jgi:hypothetical protein
VTQSDQPKPPVPLGGQIADLDRRATNTSGHTGVTYSHFHAQWGKPWLASVTVDYIRHHLGCYPSFAKAVAARRAWEQQNPHILQARKTRRRLPNKRIPYELTPKAIEALDQPGGEAA